ncbi:hypothetical protein RSO01_81970 [Reyranella soli]|uniref:Uncharacterized protein n=1 Tax=Reyranella soli TaxID=1230389 RepID=A0A512NQ13_9HYPH|nr:hypothetical protein RSO01_81970 [Reyranella soli]
MAKSGFTPVAVEKDKAYSSLLDMTTSVGREYLIVLSSSKPFDAPVAFRGVAAHLKGAAADTKGGVPQLHGVSLRRIEMGSLGSCFS